VQEHLSDRDCKEDNWGEELCRSTPRLEEIFRVVRYGVGTDSDSDGDGDGREWEDACSKALSRYRESPPAVLHIMRLLDPVSELFKMNARLETRPSDIQRPDDQIMMRLKDAKLCRPRTWLNDVVIHDYTFFLNNVARAMGASFLFLSPVDTMRLMKSPNPALETFSFSTRRVVKMTLKALYTRFKRVVFPINKENLHWTVAVLWPTVPTDDTDPTGGTVPTDDAPYTVTSYDSLGAVLHVPFYEALGAALLGVRLKQERGLCPAQEQDAFECGVLTCWNMEKILRANDTVGDITYPYEQVESYRYLILYRILGCVDK
jgi:hypothetical protein